MPVVVQKFGGSSVADVQKLSAVADKVVAAKQAGDDVVVVVSAMGRTTDELLAMAQEISADPPRRELDMLLSTGERISMSLLSMAVQKRGADAISFTGSQSGIITNDRHFDAKIIDVRPHRVEDELSRGRVVIIAGYQGMSYKREITTLGRGGSDTTAMAMAAALNADRAEIYSDVDGVYSADPRSLPSATHIPNLSYDEMQAMADLGARVLHAKAVDFVKEAGISIFARSTFKPGRETIISDQPVPAGARAVIARRDIVRVRIRTQEPSRALRLIQESLLVPHDWLHSDGIAEFALTKDETPDFDGARASLENHFGSTLEWEDSHGTISCVGGFSDTSYLARLLGCFDDAGIVAKQTRCDRLSLTLWLPLSQIDEAEALTHKELVENGVTR